ncbi:putative Pit accessory protein [Nostocoides australiense Ben110]|uniref:Putative Pit accessory protein n=1 Tax=Nostocoides australiense Ben110 TaxID=1193182 RepID=W6JYT2_9MICO|nr:putative Pit accessory protein [Tetrasphaera australiensis Ben110]
MAGLSKSYVGSALVVFRLRPRNDEMFFELLVSASGLLVDGARLLSGLCADGDAGRADMIARMHEVEHQADEISHALIRRVDTSFITPFDREDLHRLVSGLDDCMDHMDAAVDFIDVHALAQLPPRAVAQVEIIARMAELTAAVVSGLRDPARVRDYVVEVNRLENEADRGYRRLRAELLSGDPMDVLRMLQNLDIVQELEAACNAFERVAHTVEGISLKEP